MLYLSTLPQKCRVCSGVDCGTAKANPFVTSKSNCAAKISRRCFHGQALALVRQFLNNI
jgi:hypothetical protein